VQSMVFGGGNRTWGNLTFSNSSTVNWTWGSSLQNPAISAVFRNESLANMDTRLVSFNTSATAMNDRLVSFNTSATAMNDRMVLFNTSATNLDTRQKNDNASVARTNVQNTFAASQIIQGNLNVTGQINATNYTSTTFKVASCDIKADAGGSLYCGTDANTGVSNATAFTDVVQSIMAGGANRAWGNATIATGAFLTISQSAGLINPTITIAGVGNLVLANQSNTFTASQFITGNLNVSALANMTNLTVNGLTLLNMNNLTGFNYSTNYVLFAGNSINVSGLVNATQLLVYGTDVTANLSRLNISATAMNDRMVLFNTSATNLDTRQAADNASVARTNVENTFTAGQIIQGRLNVTSFVNATDLYLRGVLSCTGDLETDAAGQVTCGTDATGTANASANGTTGYVAKFANATTLDNSVMFQNGTKIGISTTSPASTLEVAGDINASSGSLVFYNEIQPDGATCSNGQILKKTGTNDWDCAADAGGAGSNATTLTDVVQSIAVGGGNRSWGNLSFVNSSTVNWTFTNGSEVPLMSIIISAIFRNESLANLDTRLVSFNTSATAMNDRLVSFNTSATLMNDRLVSFNTSATAMNDRLVLFNTSATNLDTREAKNNASQTSALNALSTNLSLFNQSATNLDTRQKNDNASVARTNVQNTFTTSQIITGDLNVTGLVNASRHIVWGVAGNLSEWINNTVPLASMNATGGLELRGGLRVTTLNAASCDLKTDGSGNFYCGTDATGAANASANGTTGYVAKFANATTLDNSVIFQNGTSIGVGTTNPIATVDLRGSINVSGRANVTGLALKDVLSCSQALETNAAGEIVCGTDADSGGNPGWQTTATLVYNDTAGVNVTIGTQNIADSYIVNILGGLNVTQKINA